MRVVYYPARISHNRPFTIEADITNRGNEAMPVVNLTGRVSVNHATGAGNVPFGDTRIVNYDALRDLAPGETARVQIETEFHYDAVGMGVLTVTMEPILFDDPNLDNNGFETSVVVE